MADKNNEKQYFNIKGMTVQNVRRIPGTELISFSLCGNGIGLYGLKIIKSAKGQFIAPPSDKGKDGKYFPRYSIYLTDEDEERIMKAVVKKLPAEEPAEDPDTL